MQRSFAVAVTAALVLSSLDAFAVAQRTFVSTSGSDANTTFNCSLVAPCRSFGSALGVTVTEGAIVVLDSGGYGRVTIDKSVAITAPANGQGGDTGIVFTQGMRLYIEQCTISNMSAHGVQLSTGDTYVTDTTIRDNSGNGIRADGSSTQVTVDRARIERNGSAGVRMVNGPRLTVTSSVVAGNFGLGGFDIASNDGSSQTVVTISESTVSQNASQGIVGQATGAGSNIYLAVTRNTISRNGASGIALSAGTGALTAVVTDNVVLRNSGTGGIVAAGAGVSATIAANAVSANLPNGVIQASSALLKTRSNNVVQDNGTDVAGTLTFVGGN